MPLETQFNYINDLNPDWPTGTDLVNVGDDHMRGIKKTITQTFPNVDGPIQYSDAELNQLRTNVTSTSTLTKISTDVDVSGKRVTNLPTPIQATDATPLGFVANNFQAKDGSGNVAVSGTLAVAKDTTIGTTTTDANLTVNGGITSTGTIVSSKGLHITGTDGALIDHNLDVTGALTVNNATNLKNTVVLDNNIALTGKLTTAGSVQLAFVGSDNAVHLGASNVWTRIAGQQVIVDGANFKCDDTGHITAKGGINTDGGNINGGNANLTGSLNAVNLTGTNVTANNALTGRTSISVGYTGAGAGVPALYFFAGDQNINEQLTIKNYGAGNVWAQVYNYTNAVRVVDFNGLDLRAGDVHANGNVFASGAFMGTDANLTGNIWALGAPYNSRDCKAYIDWKWQQANPNPSDNRLKENIVESDHAGALNRINQIDTKTFNWKPIASGDTGRRDRGFIAQDLEKIDPLYVYTTQIGQFDQKNWSTNAIIADLIDSIKTLKARIEVLEAKA